MTLIVRDLEKPFPAMDTLEMGVMAFDASAFKGAIMGSRRPDRASTPVRLGIQMELGALTIMRVDAQPIQICDLVYTAPPILSDLLDRPQDMLRLNKIGERGGEGIWKYDVDVHITHPNLFASFTTGLVDRIACRQAFNRDQSIGLPK